MARTKANIGELRNSDFLTLASLMGVVPYSTVLEVMHKCGIATKRYWKLPMELMASGGKSVLVKLKGIAMRFTVNRSLDVGEENLDEEEVRYAFNVALKSSFPGCTIYNGKFSGSLDGFFEHGVVKADINLSVKK